MIRIMTLLKIYLHIFTIFSLPINCLLKFKTITNNSINFKLQNQANFRILEYESAKAFIIICIGFKIEIFILVLLEKVAGFSWFDVEEDGQFFHRGSQSQNEGPFLVVAEYGQANHLQNDAH